MIDIPSLSPSNILERLKSNDGSFRVLDVREPFECEKIRLPFDDIKYIPSSVFPSDVEYFKGFTWAVLCRSGVRSSRVVGFLRSNGIDAFNIEGGIVSFPLPVISSFL